MHFLEAIMMYRLKSSPTSILFVLTFLFRYRHRRVVSVIIPRNFCKEIGIPEKTAVALLLDHRYLYRSPSGWLMPFADKSARGYFIVRDCYGRSGKLVQQTRVTCKGKNHLFKLFKKWGVIE